MRPSRRQVLGSGVAAVAAATGPVVFADRALGGILPARLMRRTFAPLIGSTFRFGARGVWYTAVLSGIRDLPNSRAGDPYRFSLLFTVRDSGPAQGTYAFRHPRLAPLSLFAVPVGPGRRLYEVVVVSR